MLYLGLFGLFLLLKLYGKIRWSWWAVISPLLVAGAFGFLSFAIYLGGGFDDAKMMALQGGESALIAKQWSAIGVAVIASLIVSFLPRPHQDRRPVHDADPGPGI